MSDRVKYHVAESARWRWESDDRPYFSAHALERYDERTPADAVSPERAWDNRQLRGREAKWLANHDYFTSRGHDWHRATHIHAYHDRAGGTSYTVLFLTDESGVITVYDAASLSHGPLKCYLNAHRQGCGGGA